MLTTSFFQPRPEITLNSANWQGTDALPRDRAQSRRLHEPEYRVDTIDPMTGGDIKDTTGHPCVIDGNLTIYFSSEESREAYIEMPLNHPALRLPFPASDEDDRVG